MARVTVLVDNVRVPGLAHEWGLSLAVEPDGGAFWLWDTGASGAFVDNAQTLGLDLGRAQGLAISHGHFDHGGGVHDLFARTAFRGPVRAHANLNRRRYAQFQKKEHPAGLPRPFLDFTPVSGDTVLAEGLTMVTDIPRHPGLSQATCGLYVDRECREPDSVPDDSCLVLSAKAGPVVILGCCHSGLENTLRCLQERLGLERLHGLVGGLHLYNADQERVKSTVKAIEQSGLERLHAGHCTGDAAVDYLGSRLSCRCEPLRPGLVLDF